jgi:recombination associated protein RdgC
MGAFHGTASYRQYRLSKEIPANYFNHILEGCIKHLAKEIDPNGNDTRLIGWCDAQSPMSNQLTLDQILLNDYLVVAMRIDTLNIGKGLLKLQCDQEEKRILKETKKESLTRYEKAEIKEAVEKKLRQRLFPNIKWVEMVWNTSTGVIRFFSTSKGLNEQFMELFAESFGINLIPDYPYTIAQLPEINLNDQALNQLEVVEPCSFVDAETQFTAMRS